VLKFKFCVSPLVKRFILSNSSYY